MELNETETMPNQTFLMLCQCSVTTAGVEELKTLGKLLVDLASCLVLHLDLTTFCKLILLSEN